MTKHTTVLTMRPMDPECILTGQWRNSLSFLLGNSMGIDGSAIRLDKKTKTAQVTISHEGPKEEHISFVTQVRRWIDKVYSWFNVEQGETVTQ